MFEQRRIKLDFLENSNCTIFERIKTMAIHFRNHAKAHSHRYQQTSQMGRSRRTSLIHDSHEYHTKHTSRSRLLICESCMGWVVKPLCTNRSYSTKFGSNTALYQVIHRRQPRDLTFPHSRTTKIEGGMWRIRSRHLGFPVCRSDLLIHADTLMGSHHRYLRRSSGSKNCYLASHHRVEQETRTHHLRQRPKYGIPDWHLTEV